MIAGKHMPTDAAVKLNDKPAQLLHFILHMLLFFLSCFIRKQLLVAGKQGRDIRNNLIALKQMLKEEGALEEYLSMTEDDELIASCSTSHAVRCTAES